MGARPQIEQHLARNSLDDTYHHGIRLTDAETMQCVKEAVGRVRVEIEALLSMGLPNSPMANADIRVAGGNFITAQPIGIINGVGPNAHRQCAQGRCRRAERPHGVRRSRAAFTAGLFTHGRSVQRHAGRRCHSPPPSALDADKLVFLMDTDGVQDKKGELLKELTVAQAQDVLAPQSSKGAKCKLTE